MHKLRLVLLLATVLLLGACGPSLLQRLETSLPEQHRLVVLNTEPFALLSGVATRPPASPHLRVYIEGDGRAWITPSRPSHDPTPRDDWFFLLALDDPQPSAWLGRPCQYLRSDQCKIHYWTSGRFSTEVLVAMNLAVDHLKQLHASQTIELIGYSGGAALALLLASQREDVVAVQTLAGNLSPRLWTAELNLSPLHGSLDPLDSLEQLKALPQRHLVGGRDDIMPPAIARQWQQLLGHGACSELIVLPELDHNRGWAEAWKAHRETTPSCLP